MSEFNSTFQMRPWAWRHAQGVRGVQQWRLRWMAHPNGVDREVVERDAGHCLPHGLVVQPWIAPQQRQQVSSGNHPQKAHLACPAKQYTDTCVRLCVACLGCGLLCGLPLTALITNHDITTAGTSGAACSTAHRPQSDPTQSPSDTPACVTALQPI